MRDDSYIYTMSSTCAKTSLILSLIIFILSLATIGVSIWGIVEYSGKEDIPCDEYDGILISNPEKVEDDSNKWRLTFDVYKGDKKVVSGYKLIISDKLFKEFEFKVGKSYYLYERCDLDSSEDNYNPFNPADPNSPINQGSSSKKRENEVNEAVEKDYSELLFALTPTFDEEYENYGLRAMFISFLIVGAITAIIFLLLCFYICLK